MPGQIKDFGPIKSPLQRQSPDGVLTKNSSNLPKGANKGN